MQRKHVNAWDTNLCLSKLEDGNVRATSDKTLKDKKISDSVALRRLSQIPKDTSLHFVHTQGKYYLGYGKNILLVEDNELNMEIAQIFLEEHGVNVENAWNGQEAVDIFKNSEEGFFDFIIMDIMMPVMNGLDATRTIRALDRADAKTVPIIAMSANAFEDDVKKSMEAGMNIHVSKPVEEKKLLAAVEKVMVG